jgi:uncharacterized coiled-coil protein SlyX
MSDDWGFAYGLERVRSARFAGSADEWQAYAHRLEADVAALKRNIGEWEAALAGRDKTITQYKAALAERDKAIERYKTAVAERDKVIEQYGTAQLDIEQRVKLASITVRANVTQLELRGDDQSRTIDALSALLEAACKELSKVDPDNVMPAAFGEVIEGLRQREARREAMYEAAEAGEPNPLPRIKS